MRIGLVATLYMAACNGVTLGPNAGTAASTSPSQLTTDDGAAEGTAGLTGVPRVLLARGAGSVVAAPEIQIVAASGSSKAARLSTYLSAWGQSAAFSEQVAEYGVGPLSVLPIAATTYAWPSQSFDVDPFTGGVAVSNVELAIFEAYESTTIAPAGPNTVLVVVVPDGIDVALSSNAAVSACRQGALSWHSAIRLADANGAVVPYVVVPACAAVGGLSEDDTAAMALSHALINALTNPLQMGYRGVDGNATAWPLVTGTLEAASLCSLAMYGSADVLARPDGVDGVVHRSWSNVRSQAGLSPCVPSVATDAFTAAVPQGTASLQATVPDTAEMIAAPGIALSAGRSVTVPLALRADSVDGNVIDVTVTSLSGTDLRVSLPNNSGMPGDSLSLNVAMDADAADTQYVVRLTSRRDGSAYSQYLLVKRTL